MMAKLKILRRVKELKEQQAFRALQAKRREVEKGQLAVEEARKIVEESKATLPKRENAIYKEVLGKVVNLTAIDTTRGKVVALEQEHMKLKDEEDKAVHILSRLDKELEQTSQAHKLSMKRKDKYVILTDEVKAQLDAAQELKEENEVEELFTGRRRQIA